MGFSPAKTPLRAFLRRAAQLVQVRPNAAVTCQGDRRTFGGNGDLRSPRLYYPRVSPPQEVFRAAIGLRKAGANKFLACRNKLVGVAPSKYVPKIPRKLCRRFGHGSLHRRLVEGQGQARICFV
jgi:hypothetical protein